MKKLNSLTMEYLENCFKRAIESNAKFVAVSVRVPNASTNEIIINPRENLEIKLEYYKKSYDEDLYHNAVGDTLRIVGFAFGDSFTEIQEDLLG